MKSERNNNLPTKWGFEPPDFRKKNVENVNNIDFGIINLKNESL